MVKELDFDELDRAVSNLMGSVSKTDTAGEKVEPAAGSKATNTEVSTPPTSQPPSPTPAPTVELPASSPRPSTVTPAPAPRRSGRFMDVVHPSADMKPRPITPPSREGIAITPRPSVSAPADLDKKDIPTKSEAARDTMPDPISLAESTAAPKVTMPPRQVESIPKSEAPAINGPLTDMKTGPLTSESPFLPGAKVEKRPLGNEPPTGADTKDTPPEDGKPDDTDSDYPPAPLPAELDNDLVTIESKELTAHAPATQAPKEELIPAGPISITQQYKEQPSTSDASHVAIYDEASVPHPLAHPPKKKAGWLWIIWVLLLIALGGGGAALLYATGIIP